MYYITVFIVFLINKCSLGEHKSKTNKQTVVFMPKKTVAAHYVLKHNQCICSHQNRVESCTLRQMMLSGMTPRLPSVAESSVKQRPSMERFWSNGATENACMICDF